MAGDEPGLPVRGGRVADLGGGPAQDLPVQPEGVLLMPKRRKNACQQRSTSAGSAPMADHYSQTGLRSRSPGGCSTCRRIRVPSMTGSGPSWSSQAPRWVSRACTRSHVAAAVP